MPFSENNYGDHIGEVVPVNIEINIVQVPKKVQYAYCPPC